jgi:hypothetical protein
MMRVFSTSARSATFDDVARNPFSYFTMNSVFSAKLKINPKGSRT